MSTAEIWIFTETRWTQNDLIGFAVEALDGAVGKVDEATYDVGESYIVVDTRPWIFGKKVMLPASTVSPELDPQRERKVYVARTKDEIKHAPEFDERQANFDDYRKSSWRVLRTRRGGLPQPLAQRGRPS